MNIPEGLQQFMTMVEGRFTLATIMMVAIFAGTCYLISILVTSLKTRRERMKIELPAIDDNGKILITKSQFELNKEITTELVHPNDDIAFGPETPNNEEFARALTMETKILINFDNESNLITMPKIGKIDYDKIKEEKVQEMKRMKKDQEAARISQLKELAIADREDELSEMMK